MPNIWTSDKAVDLYLRSFDESRPGASAVENVQAAALRIRTAIEYTIGRLPVTKIRIMGELKNHEERVWGFSALLATWTIWIYNGGWEDVEQPRPLARYVRLNCPEKILAYWRALDQRRSLLGDLVRFAYYAEAEAQLREAGRKLAEVLFGPSIDLLATILLSEELSITSELAARFPLPLKVPNATDLKPSQSSKPRYSWSDLDIEAAARMLSSENPRGSERLHAEQIWAQLRLMKPGQTLHDRITAGSGWGTQGTRTGEGRTRPVSTAQKATDDSRQQARKVLEGEITSTLPGATKWFEPAVQHVAHQKMLKILAKQQAGNSVSDSELQILRYAKTADEVRADWARLGGQALDTIDGVEFWT